MIITKNGERTIAQCIAAAKKAVDEVVVVDSYSNDDTIAICESLGARVFQKEWLGYGAQKNFANQKVANNYILSLDADEVLTEEAIFHINQLKKEGLNGAYKIRRLNFYFGKFLLYGLGNPEYVVRLFDKNNTSWNDAAVHEKLLLSENENVHLLKGAIQHYSYSSVEDYVKKSNEYTSLSAEKLFSKKKSGSIFKIIFSPLFVFFKSYIIKLGLLDGAHGFITAALHSYTDFLKYTKLRAMYKKNTTEL